MPKPANHRSATPTVAPNWKRPETAWVDRLHSSTRWQKLREMILARHPTCIMGCGNLAGEVHRINPHDPDLFFDVQNLAPLCSDCHAKVNAAYHRGISAEILFPQGQRLKPGDMT